MYTYISNFKVSSVKHVDESIAPHPKLVKLCDRLGYNVEYGTGINVNVGYVAHSIIFKSRNQYLSFVEMYGNEYNGSDENIR